MGGQILQTTEADQVESFASTAAKARWMEVVMASRFLVLSTANLEAITASIQRAFAAVDAKLSTWSALVVCRI